MKLLHLSYDYPDVINIDKTEAIKKLIEITNDFDSTGIVSLNRTISFKNQGIHRKNNVLAINTFGLPMGIFFGLTLLGSIKWVLAAGLDLKEIDLVHAHKLTFEGPIAFYLHRRFNLPYIVTIQQTDFKVLKYKPLMKAYYYKLLKEARNIVLISPWMERQLDNTFGSKCMEPLSYKICSIPLVVDRKCIGREYDNGKFICVFHMRTDYIKIKNIYRVLQAISMLRKAGVNICLDIAGDGPARARVENMINRLDLHEQVKMLGKVENDRMVELMSGYRAFVLCSYPETFGMVYIEALSAGIPVIYSKAAGIDGFFDNKGVGIAVRYNSIAEISRALSELNSDSAEFRLNVQRLQKSGCLNQFSPDSIRQKYLKIYGKTGADNE